MPFRSIFQKGNPQTPKKRHSRTASQLELADEENETPTRRQRSSTFVSSPRTPLSRILTSFGGKGRESWSDKTTVKDQGEQQQDMEEQEEEEVVRPGSASSSYSSSSDDSLVSRRTMRSSYTIPEDMHTDSPLLPAAVIYKKEDNAKIKQARMRARMRNTEWTKEMDAHLWGTYIKYQQDPTVTPFHVPPASAPPLGVCLRVARATKLTWAELCREKRNMMTPRPRRTRARTPLMVKVDDDVDLKISGVNKGDFLRKAAGNAWPASESATRKRLRILCRRQYGSSRRVYRGYVEPDEIEQERRNRNRFQSPEAIPQDLLFSCSPDRQAYGSALAKIYEQDQVRFEHDALLSSTRSMELSLATSTAMSMQPDGVLAEIAGGQGEDGLRLNDPDATEDESEITNEISPIHGRYPLVAAAICTAGMPSVGQLPHHEMANPNFTSGIEPPVLLSPLQLRTGSSLYGTWPRRRKHSDDEDEYASDDQDGLFQSQGSNHIKQALGDLFSETTTSTVNTGSPAPKTPITQPRSRSRGVTFSAGSSNGLGGHHRLRPSPDAPFVSVAQQIPSWAHEKPSEASNRPSLAQLLGAQPFSAGRPARLGSPFVPDNANKGKGHGESPDDEDDLHFELRRPSTAHGIMMSTGNALSGDKEKFRPAKRVKE